jgi:mRNA interferase MazF
LVKRGEICLAALGEPVGREQSHTRPVLLVSAQPWLDSNPAVVATLPITRAYRGRSTHLEIEGSSSGLRETSYVRCEDIRAVSVERISAPLGRLDEVDLVRVDAIVRRLLGL